MQTPSFDNSLAEHEKKIQELSDKGFQQLMLMVQHYMEKTKKQFKNFKRKNIEMKIEDAKRMYENLDNKLDEVSIGVVRIEEAAAAKIQEVTSSAKFHTKIEI